MPAFLLGIFSLVFAIISWVIPVHADQSQSFVWVGDAQGGSPGNLVNKSVLNPIMDTILAMNPAPKVVFFGGDAAFTGGTANLTYFQSLFTDRLTAAGIPSAIVIGNHELYTQSLAITNQALSRQQDFQALFNSTWTQNGPGAAYNNLAFSFHLGNTLFIIADSYYATENGPAPPYGINTAQQNWMKGLLQNNTAAHSFVLTHVPSYVPSIPSANPDNPYTWTTITTSGNAGNTNASMMLTAHEHLYYRTIHDGTYEVLSGSAGAPLQCSSPPCSPVNPGDVLAMRYNYTTVTVNGRYVTVSVLDQNNQFIDWFQFFDNSGINNSTITNTIAIAPDPAEKQPSGILAGSYNTITNNAPISNVFTGIDAVSNNIITNTSTITPLSGGNGIHVYDNNTITNTTTGAITGNSKDLWGIWVNTGNTVLNQGTVNVSGTNSVAFLAQGDNNTLTNTGTLSASGTDSYAAKFLGTGNTILNTGTISGNLWFDAGDNAFTNNGTFNGSGGLYKANSGTLTLRGPTSYTGGTYLNGGVINVTQDASLGALSGKLLFDGGTLQVSADMTSARNVTLNGGGGTFDTNGNALTLSGVISGSGNLTKTGTGTLTLSNVNTYTGQGAVSNGLLFLAPGASLGSTMTVNPGGAVGGYGTLSNVINNGTVSPGGSIGTLTINGNYTQGGAGKLLIEVASPASNDLLAVTGTANLNGTLQTLWSGGYTPALGTTFGTILTATSGVTGQFFSLLTNITPTIVFKPRYDIANQVSLMVERDYTNQTLFSFLTPNQRAVGAMLNSVANTATGDLNTVLNAIDTLPSYNLTAYAFDQLAPRVSQAQYSMGINAASFQSINIAERLSELRLGVRGISFNGFRFRNTDFQRNGIDTPILLASAGHDLTGMLPQGMDQRWGFFVKGNAVTGTQKDTSEQQGYTFTSAGITLGSDYRITDHFIAGLMLGAAGSRASVDNSGSKVTMDGLSMGTYGTYYKNRFYADGQFSYGLADYDNTRRIVFPGLDRTATSKPSGQQMTAYLGAGYELPLNQWMITPNVSLKYVSLNINSYTENGAGAINLAVDRQSIESLQGTIGMKVSYGWQTEKTLVIPNFRASWGYEFLKDTQNITASLAQGSSPFSTQAISPNRNFLSLGTGITAITRNNISFSLSYDAQIGENKYFACNVNAGVRVRF